MCHNECGACGKFRFSEVRKVENMDELRKLASVDGFDDGKDSIIRFEKLKTIEELDLQREQLDFMKAQAMNADKAHKKMFIVALVSAATALASTIATLLQSICL